MKIENYYVKDIAQFSDYLIRNLIKANISYVFIKPNEIHYNDKIIRLHYDPTKTNSDIKDPLEIGEYLDVLENTDVLNTYNQDNLKNNYYKNQPKINVLKRYYKRNL